MHVITFYSFKGGVGRSLALANIGVELAQTGRRVLMVDFDLEAPGLHTFQALEPIDPPQGIVDFVTQYRKDHTAPDAAEYTYEALGIGRGGGRLWVMPAGRLDSTYSNRLASLDWQRLYREEEGFLLFEDLKAQWQKLFSPDYVLIDSRTGHTDVQGICTRQLPDAVVLFFFPNKQNLDGLQQVVATVQKESSGPLKKHVELYFVMSNVPELDDEEEIIKSRLSQFREQLEFTRLAATIHRYDSLALINQVIFTRERPKSRLAKEYQQLKDVLVERNPEDRDGAIQFLNRTLRSRRRGAGRSERRSLPDINDKILKSHPKDPAILHLLALVNANEGETEEALSLLDRAIEGGGATVELASSMHMARGDMRIRLGDKPGARDDLLTALAMPMDEAFDLERAVRMLRTVDEEALVHVKDAPGVATLSFSERLSLSRTLDWSRHGLMSKIEILAKMLEDQEMTVAHQQDAKFELGLAYIGVGQFALARDLFDQSAGDASTKTAYAFNSAMAQWGLSGEPPIDGFRTVLSLAGESDRAGAPDPNFHQCIAVCEWAVGNGDQARHQLNQATEAIVDRGRPSFSCWRYLLVAPSEFLKDCKQIGELLDGKDVRPLAFDVELKPLTAG